MICSKTTERLLIGPLSEVIWYLLFIKAGMNFDNEGKMEQCVQTEESSSSNELRGWSLQSAQSCLRPGNVSSSLSPSEFPQCRVAVGLKLHVGGGGPCAEIPLAAAPLIPPTILPCSQIFWGSWGQRRTQNNKPYQHFDLHPPRQVVTLAQLLQHHSRHKQSCGEDLGAIYS